jgi:two-component system cell cycle sensor histidine kinase/response regulator CckA
MQRLLVIEDSPTQAEELRLILESAGFEVAAASDGRHGLDQFMASRFDAVISDILMPRMSGYEFCRAAKSRPETRDIPIMLLTTLSDPPMDIIQGLECGADNFISKPYEAAALIARVQSMLRGKRMRDDTKLKVGVELFFLGKKFTIDSDKEQILDTLISTFEGIVHTNRELRAREVDLAVAKAKIEDYAKQLEGRVRVSEQKYRSLMEHANDAIFVIDAHGTTLEINRQTEQLLGRPASAIVGRPFHEFVISGERDYASVQFQKILEDGQATIRDLRLDRQDATFVCADFSASLVHTEGRQIVLAIARDMTERNRLQHQVLQNEKLVTVGTLAAGIAHEINNPTAVVLANMGVIRAYADDVAAMLAEGGGLDRGPELERATAELDEVIHDCTHAAERIRDIVRDLKGFAHIGEGDVGLVNINERLDATLRMASNEVRYRARIEKDFGGDLPAIVASPGKLGQVFLNLIVNATQAIDEGKIEENKITITTRFEDGRIRVSVRDTGKGIPQEILFKIFDPFFTTKPVGAGTGLGLSICQDIVKKHNGEIRVESEIGRGTTFSVYLPLDTGLELPSRRAVLESSETPGSNLMVIDDEPSLLKAYQRMLGGRHKVTLALGGRAAVELLSASGPRYDVFLCDLMMPDIDGVDLHGYIAEKYPGLERRMAFISGGAFTPRVQEFLARVDNPRLEKPFAIDDLRRVIAAVLAAK